MNEACYKTMLALANILKEWGLAKAPWASKKDATVDLPNVGYQFVETSTESNAGQ